MCTLAIAVASAPGHPLLVAANRDEALARPAEVPFLWNPAGPLEPRILAPRDVVGGGTWIGLNEAGLFVAITNRFGAPKDPTRTSRGWIVLEALKQRSTEAVSAWLQEEALERYSPFHLVYADGRTAAAIAWTGEARVERPLGRGLHVFTERSFGAGDDSRRVSHFQALWPATAELGALTSLLSRHDPEAPFDAPCVHAPAFDYGTRSSLVLARAERLSDSKLLFTRASPCTSAFEDGAALIAGLTRS